MRGVGWVKGKNRDPFLAGTRLKFPNVVILSINHDKKIKEGSWLQFNAISPETQTLWKQGGAVVRVLPSHPSHHCELGSIPGPGITCGFSWLLVLVLASRGFLWVLQFSSLGKILTL